MTYIRQHILIKTDTGVFPGKAPILRPQERLSCFVHVTLPEPPPAEWGKQARLRGSWCTCSHLCLFCCFSIKEVYGKAQTCPVGVVLRRNPGSLQKCTWNRVVSPPARERIPQGTASSLRLTGSLSFQERECEMTQLLLKIPAVATYSSF